MQKLWVIERHDFTLTGVLAGALGVARAFLTVSGLSTRPVDSPNGLSLWHPEKNWLDEASDGPDVQFLPSSLWILGLGHLGQAFIWNLALLPYPPETKPNIFLQDFDNVIVGNWASGMLCDEDSPGKLKTRLCSRWLEARGFSTRIIERAFDETTKRHEREPGIAYCGVDSGSVRALLGDANFDFVVECGLGGETSDFDELSLHTFPEASKSPKDLWLLNKHENLPPLRSKVTAAALNLAVGNKGVCGIIGDTLAGKAVSTSFVGAFAAALAMAEIIRGFHGGVRCEAIRTQLRRNDFPTILLHPKTGQTLLAKAGYITSETLSSRQKSVG